MTLTLARIREHIDETVVGGDTAASVLMIANNSGRSLFAAYPWGFAKGGQAFLELRPSVPTLASNNAQNTGATWDENLLQLTDAGAFADYEFREGDQVQIVDGTNVVPGFYPITAKDSGNSIITLGRSIQPSGSSPASSVDYRINLSFALLPDDFGELLFVQLTDTLTRTMHRTTLADIGARRSGGVNIDDINYWYALSNTTPDGQPIRRLELYPEPRTFDREGARLLYRRKWVNLATDNDEVRLPDELEPLYLEFVQAFALGYEEGDKATVSQRVAEVKRGPLYEDARRWDARQVPFVGKLRHGHVRPVYYGNQYVARQSISGPI